MISDTLKKSKHIKVQIKSTVKKQHKKDIKSKTQKFRNRYTGMLGV